MVWLHNLKTFAYNLFLPVVHNQLVRRHRFAAMCANILMLDSIAAGFMNKLIEAGGQVLFAPHGDSDKNVIELAALARQHVTITRRMLLIQFAFKKAV